MTLRDLTKSQLYNLQRRCEKERKEWFGKWYKLKTDPMTAEEKQVWQAAYSQGLKAGLGLQPGLEARL